jgi:hypothetical protein
MTTCRIKDDIDKCLKYSRPFEGMHQRTRPYPTNAKKNVKLTPGKSESVIKHENTPAVTTKNRD